MQSAIKTLFTKVRAQGSGEQRAVRQVLHLPKLKRHDSGFAMSSEENSGGHFKEKPHDDDLRGPAED